MICRGPVFFFLTLSSRFLLEWYRLKPHQLQRFRIAKALHRLLRYLLPLWRGRVLRNHGDDNLVNDFLFWAVYTHYCHDVFYMLGYSPTQRCCLVESEGEILKSGHWQVAGGTPNQPLVFFKLQSSLWQPFSAELCFRVHKKQHVFQLKPFDTWSLEPILFVHQPEKNTFGDTMTATLNSHVLMQVPNIWMPELQTKLSLWSKIIAFLYPTHPTSWFCCGGFWWPWRSRPRMVAGNRKNNQPKRVHVFPHKKSSENTRKRHGNHWNQIEPMYAMYIIVRISYVSTDLLGRLKGHRFLWWKTHTHTHNFSQVQKWGSLLIWIPCMLALLGVCWALLQQEATHKELTILVTGGDGWGWELNENEMSNIPIRFYHFEQLPHVFDSRQSSHAITK